MRALAQKQATKHLHGAIADPALRAKLTPSWEFGCKRVLLSNDYYPALAQDNVEVVANGITEVRPNGVVDSDGVLHEVDVIIYGTGFRVMDISIARRLRGRDGRSLTQTWEQGGAQVHRGTTVAGYPNLFLLLGPNTALAHNSVVLMIEAQITYVMEALKTLQTYGVRALEVRQSAQDVYNEGVQKRLQTTVWNSGGCRSWYRDANGRNFALWPTHTFTFRKQMATFDAQSYELRARTGEFV